MAIEILRDKGLFDNDDNAHEVSRDYSFVEEGRSL